MYVHKKFSTGLKSLGFIILAVVLLSLFGFGSITKLVFKKFLFTPYNIVGIIMTIVTICGGYITKRQGHWIKLTLTILCGIVSLFSFACTVCSWFNIDLLNIIWVMILKPPVISVGTVFLWILIILVGIIVAGFTIYGLIKIISYIKEEKDWKNNQRLYHSQKTIVDQIAKDNINSTKITKIPIQNTQKLDFYEQRVIPIQAFVEQHKGVLKENTNNIVLPNDYELKISNNICPECGWYLKKELTAKLENNLEVVQTLHIMIALLQFQMKNI